AAPQLGEALSCEQLTSLLSTSSGERVKVFAEESEPFPDSHGSCGSAQPLSTCNTSQPAPIAGMHPRPEPIAFRPILASMAGHIHGEFQPAPDSQFVEDASQVVLN